MTDIYVRGTRGAQLYVRDFGSEGPTLLLIHGSGHSSANWEAVAPMLVQHLRVLAMDVRSHRRSAGPPDGPYDLPVLIADAIAVLDGFGVDRAQVMAQSMGGRIGELIALMQRAEPEGSASYPAISTPAVSRWSTAPTGAGSSWRL